MRSLISHFPDEFKRAFVSDGQINGNDVIRLLRPKPITEMIEKKKIVWECLLFFCVKLLHKVCI